MKAFTKIAAIFVLVVLFLGVWAMLHRRGNQKGQEKKTVPFLQLTMVLETTSFKNNEYIPAEFTCDGEDISPPFSVSGIPEGAKSLVLIVDDPDSLSGTWAHWIVWNIDPGIQEIPANSMPRGGLEGFNDFGKPGYGGPCPGSGTHRYFFKLYALDVNLDMGLQAKIKDIEKAMESHVLSKAQLVGLYKRK